MTPEFRESRAKIVGVGTATSPASYSQDELLEIFQIDDRRIRSLFRNSAIERRFLVLPPIGPDGNRAIETQGELLRKHRTHGIEMGSRALHTCLERANAKSRDVRYLCCVSTTGLLTPGLSALLCRELDLRRDCGRLDVVGMGCNAGLNGLGVVVNWAMARPGQLAVLLCAEVCSAAYVFDATMRTAVVNSLFGDGAAAIAVMCDTDGSSNAPRVLKFSSCLIPEALDAMRYDWDDDQGKFSFFLDRDVPYVVGAHAELAIDQLLEGTNLRRKDIAHWVVHAGGKKVIDAVRVNLGLAKHDIRHTSAILREYGNVSSASFLFSYERLLAEAGIEVGDNGLLMAMGPGSTIETALIQW